MIYITEFDFNEIIIHEAHNSIETLIGNSIFSKGVNKYALNELKSNGYVYCSNYKVLIDHNHSIARTYIHYEKLIVAIRKFNIKTILI